MPRQPGNGAVGLGLVAAGCCATLAQVAVLRELLLLAAGSELAAGLSLAAWLLSTGAGAALGAKARPSEGSLSRLLALGAPLIPAAVLLTRLARTLLPVPPGEVVPLPLVLAGGLAATPFCVIAGAVFPVALAASRLPVAAAYGLEALGAALGGVAFILAAGRLTQLELALAAALLPLAAALLLAPSRRTLVVPVLCAAAVLGLWSERAGLERMSRAWQWPRWQVLRSTDSPYGNLTAARTPRSAAQVDVFASGLWAFSCPDEQAAEQALLPLLAHPRPERLLLLGLPPPLVLAKILSHPQVRQVTCVELDAALPQLLRQSLPPAQAAPLSDGRLRLHLADPRQWVVGAAPGAFDVVLLLAPEPRTAAGSRLWSAEFFGRLGRLLAPGGVLAFHAAAAPYALGPLEADYLACLVRSAAAAGRVSALPAAGVTFIVTRGGPPPQPARMAQRLTNLHLGTRYVTPQFLRYELSPFRLAYLEAALAESRAQANTDLSPRCFYFNTVLWSGQHAAWLGHLYTALGRLPEPATAWGLALLPLLPAALLPAMLIRGRRPRRRSATLAALAAVGFSTMAAQVALLVLFQVAHGSLYLQLALLVAAFMAGLGAGAGLGAARPTRRPEPAVLVLGLLAAALALGASRLLAAPAWVFAAASALLGLAAGHAFPALAASLTHPGERTSAAGVAYGAELAGSALGSVLVSLIVVPLAGLTAALWAAAAAGLTAAMTAGWARWQG